MPHGHGGHGHAGGFGGHHACGFGGHHAGGFGGHHAGGFGGHHAGGFGGHHPGGVGGYHPGGVGGSHPGGVGGHHHHPGGVPIGVHTQHYGHRRGVHIGSIAYGRTISKATIKRYIIAGVVLLIAAVIFILFGGLLIGGVFTEGSLVFAGMPLMFIGIVSLIAGLVLLRVSCVAVPQQTEVCPEQAINQVYGQSATNPAFDVEAFPATPGPPPPFDPAAQPFQPPLYSWSSPAPFDGAPAFSVQGPSYSGFQYTSFPDSGTGNSNPTVSPWVT